MSGRPLKRFNAFRVNADAETKQVRPPYLFGGGAVLQIFSAVGGPARMAPCGGAVLRGAALGPVDIHRMAIADTTRWIIAL